MRDRSAEARIGVLIYDGVEPIDIGGTVGVISMARRMLPNLFDLVIAPKKGPVKMAGGLVVEAPYGIEDAPTCEVLIVCGGPGWVEAAQDPEVIAYLRSRRPNEIASVCTGAMILAAAGHLDGRSATTRRVPVGNEARTPFLMLPDWGTDITPREAAIVDDTVITGGGVSLAIDCTLYLLGRLYGPETGDLMAKSIEYDRSLAANKAALGHIVASR